MVWNNPSGNLQDAWLWPGMCGQLFVSGTMLSGESEFDANRPAGCFIPLVTLWASVLRDCQLFDM